MAVVSPNLLPSGPVSHTPDASLSVIYSLSFAGLPSLLAFSFPHLASSGGNPQTCPQLPEASHLTCGGHGGGEWGFCSLLRLNIFHTFVYSLNFFLGPSRFTGSGICMPFSLETGLMLSCWQLLSWHNFVLFYHHDVEGGISVYEKK